MRALQKLEEGDRLPRVATRSPAGGGHSALLALQRSAGNRALAALLRPPVVQRACGCGTCGGCSDNEADKGADKDRDDEASVQREEEPAEPAATQASSVATPRVESCAGSTATDAAGADTGAIGATGLDITSGPGVGGPTGETEGPGGTELPGGIQTPGGEGENPVDPLAEPAVDTSTCKTLSWSDFPESDKSGAFTSYAYKKTGTTFTAEFDSASSYRSKNVEKVFDGHLSDCNSTDFENFGFEIDGKPEATCTATKQPGPAKATKKEECASKIKPLVEAANTAESARLLRHEQYHMKMGCTLAAKGTAALAAGKAVTTGTLTKKDAAQSTSYDSKAQTDHSCNQTSQTAWEADIDAGLPKVTF